MRGLGRAVLDILALAVLFGLALVAITAITATTGALAYVVSTSPAVQMVLAVILTVAISVYWWGKIF